MSWTEQSFLVDIQEGVIFIFSAKSALWSFSTSRFPDSSLSECS